MAHWVKWLSYKLEDPKSGPQFPHKMQGMAIHIPKPMPRGGAGAPVFAGSLNQPTGKFQLSKRPYLQKKSNRGRPEANLWPHMHMNRHGYLHTWTSVQAHTYTPHVLKHKQ